MNAYYTPLAAVLVLAAAFDIRRGRIPNRLTYPAILGALAMHAVYGGWGGFIFGLEGLGVGFAPLILFYAAGRTGAGDVKLMAAVGAFLGPVGALWAFLLTAIAGGVYAVALSASRGRFLETLKNTARSVRTLIFTGRFAERGKAGEGAGLKLHYGAAIAAGTLVSLIIQWKPGF